jgi:hypothetical protein
VGLAGVVRAVHLSGNDRKLLRCCRLTYGHGIRPTWFAGPCSVSRFGPGIRRRISAVAASTVNLGDRALNEVAARLLRQVVAGRSVRQVVAARSLRQVSPDRDGAPVVRAAPPDARAAVRAAPPDVHAAVPYLRSAPLAAEHTPREEAARERLPGAGQVAVGFGMPRRAPMRTQSESV